MVYLHVTPNRATLLSHYRGTKMSNIKTFVNNFIPHQEQVSLYESYKYWSDNPESILIPPDLAALVQQYRSKFYYCGDDVELLNELMYAVMQSLLSYYMETVEGLIV